MSKPDVEDRVDEALKRLEAGELSISKLDDFLGNPNLAALARSSSSRGSITSSSLP